MLLNFAVENYRSIGERQVLSLMAVDGLPHKESLLSSYEGRSALPLAVLFGANASGKSNILRAFGAMRNMVVGSVRLNPEESLDEYEPFLLNEERRTDKTEFEIEFLFELDGTLQHYRYGFCFTGKAIEEEWLFETKDGEELCLFTRGEGNELDVDPQLFPEGVNKADALHSNRLFLSLVAQLKGDVSTSIIAWFRESRFITALHTEQYIGRTFRFLNDDNVYSQHAKRFLRDIDVSIQDLSFEEEKIDREKYPVEMREVLDKLIDSGIQKLRVQSIHNCYNLEGAIIGQEQFDLEGKESEGTQKITELLGLIFGTLSQGTLLVVDELDAKLHPLLTRAIIQLFTNAELNKKGAQLIFTTHDTNQLNLDYVRRDEIWFTEKTQQEETQLYSHINFEDFDEYAYVADEYVRGRYGAIPRIKLTRV